MTEAAGAFPPPGAVRIDSIVLFDCSVERGDGDAESPGEVETRGEIKPARPADGKLSYVARIRCSLQDAAGDLVLQIETAYVATYDLGDKYEPTPEEIESYAWGAVVFHVHPYFREFISGMTVRAGLPPLLLPVLERDAD